MPLTYTLHALVVLYGWLFLSAFVWSHSPPQFNNAWLVGLFGWMFASLASELPAFRHANVLLGFWLLASAWLLRTQSALTIWNSTAVGALTLLVLTAAETPTSSSPSPRRPE